MNQIFNLQKEDYYNFLKNLFTQSSKVKSSFEIKNIKEIIDNKYIVTIKTPSKNIFKYKTTKISSDYFIDFESSNNSQFPLLKEKSNDLNYIKKLNNHSEENLNILFTLINPKEEKIEIKFTKNPPNEKENSLTLEIWYGSSLLKSVNLEEKGIKFVYSDEIFGKPKFSPNGKKIIFLSELDNKKNYKNYFDEDFNGINKDRNFNGNGNDDKENYNHQIFKNLKKFEYAQDFGEELEGKIEPIITIYNLEKEEIGFIDTGLLYKKTENELNLDLNLDFESEFKSKSKSKLNLNDNLYNKIYPIGPFFDHSNEDIIFSGFCFKNDLKLGSIFCLKRPSKIYMLKKPFINWKKTNKNTDSNTNINTNEENLFPFENKLFILTSDEAQKDNEEENTNINTDKTSKFKILYIDIENEIKTETIFKDLSYNYSNMYPMLSENGENLIYFSTEKATPHMNGYRLNLIKWKEEKEKLEKKLQEIITQREKLVEINKNKNENKDNYIEKNTKTIELIKLNEYNYHIKNKILINKINFTNDYFCGVYCYNDILSKSLFLTNDKILINTHHKNLDKLFIFDIKKEILIAPYHNINVNLIDKKTIKINSNNENDNNEKNKTLFFTNNSYVNIFPFVCMWDTNYDNYNKIINEIITKENNEVYYDNTNDDNNNNDNNNDNNEKILFDKIIKLKTQEIKGILNNNINNNKNDLKIIYLSKENTNKIFSIGQIEKENFEYFEEFDINRNNDNNNNNKSLSFFYKENENKNIDLNFLHKNYLNDIVKNTKVIDYKSNGTYGHFIYLDEKENLNKEKKPIIYFLHGGPNGNLSKQFLLQNTLFLANGYNILVPNYLGSSGYGQEYLNSLNGKIGELDVDCIGEYLINFLNEKKDEFNLDEKNIIAFGGSHGGYLGAWIICNKKYNKYFSSALLRNPVIDLNSMLATTDIPDWVLGFSSDKDIDFHYPPTEDIYMDFYKKSPIFSVRNCNTPTMLNLGMKDLRVNYFNGLYFYKALKTNNCITKLTLYPEDFHPLSNDETDIDYKFQMFYWIKDNLRK